MAYPYDQASRFNWPCESCGKITHGIRSNGKLLHLCKFCATKTNIKIDTPDEMVQAWKKRCENALKTLEIDREDIT